MARSNTRKIQEFTRAGSVTYSLSNPPYSTKEVTITLPEGSDWTSGLHWHETHTEYLLIVGGSALVTLDNVTKTFNSSDRIITIPRYARHEWKRATSGGGPLIVKEWTDPADGQKEVFFRNLSSVIQDWVGASGPKQEWWLNWQLWVCFRSLDNWPVLLSGKNVPVLGGCFEWTVTHFVFLVATLFGKLLGLKGVYQEYTPTRNGVTE